MSEKRSVFTVYDNEEAGKVKVDDAVVAVIAGMTATEIKGVSCLRGGISNKTVAQKGGKGLSKSVRVSVDEEQLVVDICLDLEYGYSIPEVGSEVQHKVKNAIESMTGMCVGSVNVHVDDIEKEV